MNKNKNRTGVLRQLTALQGMDSKTLEDKWRDLYGTEPPRFKKTFLQKRLAFRIQELFYGGLEDRVKEKIREAAKEDAVALRPANSPIENDTILPGTRFIRDWNGKTYETIAREDGFEYNGQMYGSLTAIATAITGTKWNGQVWWGLKNRRKTGK